MTKFTVKKDETNGLVLCKDGKECICPFQPSIPTQTQMGGFAIMRLPCATICPHADYLEHTDANGIYRSFIITCSGKEQLFDIEEIKNNTNVYISDATY